MYANHPYVAQQAARDYTRDRIREAEAGRTAREVRARGRDSRPATARAAGALVLSVLLCVAVSGVLVIMSSGDSSAASTGSRRPRPTAPATATPTATTAPTAAPTTPTPTDATTSPPATCDGAVTWGGTAYCPVYIGELVRNFRPVGLAGVLQQVTVVGGYGQTVTIMGGTWCPPATWCGQTLDIMDVTFPAGAAVPSYGDVVDVFGHVISGGLDPAGFTVVGHCDPELGC